MYTGRPPWDIDRPQPAFLELLKAGALWGSVLDVGCGTGEHALMAAEAGLDATGIDLAAAAVERAESKARERGLTVRFMVHDTLGLALLGEQYDTVLDSGLFHARRSGPGSVRGRPASRHRSWRAVPPVVLQ